MDHTRNFLVPIWNYYMKWKLTSNAGNRFRIQAHSITVSSNTSPTPIQLTDSTYSTDLAHSPSFTHNPPQPLNPASHLTTATLYHPTILSYHTSRPQTRHSFRDHRSVKVTPWAPEEINGKLTLCTTVCRGSRKQNLVMYGIWTTVGVYLWAESHLVPRIDSRRYATDIGETTMLGLLALLSITLFYRHFQHEFDWKITIRGVLYSLHISVGALSIIILT